MARQDPPGREQVCLDPGDTRSYGNPDRHLNPAVVSCDEILVGTEPALLVRLACGQVNIQAEVNLDLPDDEVMVGVTPDGGVTRQLMTGGLESVMTFPNGMANPLPYAQYLAADRALNDTELAPILVDATGHLRVVTHSEYIEDTSSGSGQYGTAVLAVRHDAEGSLVTLDGDWANLQLDALGRLRTAIGTITPGTGATDLGKAEDAAHADGDVGVMSLTVRKDTPTALSSADPDYQPLITNNLGGLYVTEIPSGAVGSNQASVTNAGTRVQLAAASCKSITIKAKDTNTGYIYVGNSGVTSANGFILGSGETVSVDVNNANLMWIDSSVNNEGVSYIYIN